MIKQVLHPRRSTTMPKRLLQKTLKHFREYGLNAEKTSDGVYEVYADQDLVMRALNGTRNYLVQYNTDLFEPDTREVTP